MLSLKETVYGIECLGVEISLAALCTDLRLHSLNRVEFVVKPVLLTDLSLRGLSSTEFADHGFPVTAYTVMMMNAPSSLNRQSTRTGRSSLADHAETTPVGLGVNQIMGLQGGERSRRCPYGLACCYQDPLAPPPDQSSPYGPTGSHMKRLRNQRRLGCSGNVWLGSIHMKESISLDT